MTTTVDTKPFSEPPMEGVALTRPGGGSLNGLTLPAGDAA